ncbi:glycosyltransferase [Gordonia sp. NPDC003504]
MRDRIARYYGAKDIPIVAPPLTLNPSSETMRIATSDRCGLVWVGRIVEPYKRLELLLEAMRLLPQETLTVIGDGPDRERLESRAPTNVIFKGWVPRTEIWGYYSAAQLLVFPGEDDFGITPIESMSCGTPVVAYRAGGAKDTVVEGFNGNFFDEPQPEDLSHSIKNALTEVWDADAIANSAKTAYGTERFVAEVREAISL